MKKLICRKCGNGEFKVLNVGETLCKCGQRLTKLSDYQWETPKKWNENQRRRAEIISKVSLLKREIDKCLDERDEEGFKKRSLELKLCYQLLETTLADPQHRLKERIKQNQNKFSF
jgi:ribosomal protein L37E